METTCESWAGSSSQRRASSLHPWKAGADKTSPAFLSACHQLPRKASSPPQCPQHLSTAACCAQPEVFSSIFYSYGWITGFSCAPQPINLLGIPQRNGTSVTMGCLMFSAHVATMLVTQSWAPMVLPPVHVYKNKWLLGEDMSWEQSLPWK